MTKTSVELLREVCNAWVNGRRVLDGIPLELAKEVRELLLEDAFHAEPQRTIVDDAMRRIASDDVAGTRKYAELRTKMSAEQRAQSENVRADLLAVEPKATQRELCPKHSMPLVGIETGVMICPVCSPERTT